MDGVTRAPAPGSEHPHHHPNYGLPLFLIYRELRLARGASDPLDDLGSLLGVIGGLVVAGLAACVRSAGAWPVRDGVFTTGWMAIAGAVVGTAVLASTLGVKRLGWPIAAGVVMLLGVGAAVFPEQGHEEPAFAATVEAPAFDRHS